MESDDLRRDLPAWPGWGLLMLATAMVVFTIKLMPFPVAEAKFMGKQLMIPGATITFELPTGVKTPAGAHELRDPSVTIEVLSGSDWVPAPQQPVLVATSTVAAAAPPVPEGADRVEVVAWLRFTLPPDPTLRGTEARLVIPVEIAAPGSTDKPWKKTYKRKFVYATEDMESRIVTWKNKRRYLRWGALGLAIGGLAFMVVRRAKRRRTEAVI